MIRWTSSRLLTTFGRTSTFTAAQTRTIVAILLADLLPGVKADCTIDRYALPTVSSPYTDWMLLLSGDEHCTLSVAARVGFGFLLAFLIIALAWYMRYRHRRAARIYLANALQTHARSANNRSGGPRPPNTPQYPPPARGSPGAVPLYAYDPSTGFAPPARSPPQYYTPPPGASPGEEYKVSFTVSLSRCQRETGDTSGFGR
ncbi:hypothetical protein EDB84DRAFT_609813 [Lactarius hengduanensis]|nr:hypothetical protein EDB84DRAFT_609813 [Lactarius hengduanensis]